MSLRLVLILLLAASSSFGVSCADAQAGITYEYDALGRLVKSDPTHGEEVSYQYDASDNRTQVTRNMPPIAQPDSATTPHNTPVTFNPLSNDYDPESDDITLVSVSTPSSGSATAYPGAPSITYTPATGFSGTATFTYVVRDQYDATSIGNVSVAVAPATNLPPVAVDDVLYVMLDNIGDTYFGGEITGWGANDYDPDPGDTLKLFSISGNSNFNIVTTPSGNKYLRYSGPIGSGHQVVSYTIEDALGATDTAQIDVYFFAY
jgi:large repetitive protein